MAYTSIIPVSRLDNSITYIRNKDKTTKKGQSAGSLEEAIDYAMNRDKTERSVFEDAIGCVCETAYQDMVETKKRYYKMDGVQGYHLVQSFAKGEVTPELAHQIGMELTERLLQGKYEAVITTHLNTEHYHNHIVFNSVSMEDGKKYHSNSRSYYEDVRKASDALCLKYGLSVIEPKNSKGKSYAQWMAEQDGKPTWRTSIRLDIRDAVAESFTWKQFLEQMKQRGVPVEAEPEVHCIKSTGDGTVYPSAEPWEELLGREHPAVDLTAKEQDTCWERRNFPNPEKEVKGDTGPVLFLSVSDGCSKAEAKKDLPGASCRHPETGCQDRADGIPPEASDHHP